MDPVQKAVINHTFGVSIPPKKKQVISCNVCQLRFNSDVSITFFSLKCVDCAGADWPEDVHLFTCACSVASQHRFLLMTHWLQGVQFPSDLDSVLQI